MNQSETFSTKLLRYLLHINIYLNLFVIYNYLSYYQYTSRNIFNVLIFLIESL